MIASAAALKLIEEFEGYAKELPDGRVLAYPDPATHGPPWTIGFGSTGSDIGAGTIWTREEAERRLAFDVSKFASGVTRLLGDAETNQHQFDAMVSFAYNLGLGNLGASTLLRKHKAGDYERAAQEFLKWDKAAGRRMAGLTRRRAAESALYRGDAAEQDMAA